MIRFFIVVLFEFELLVEIFSVDSFQPRVFWHNFISSGLSMTSFLVFNHLGCLA